MKLDDLRVSQKSRNNQGETAILRKQAYLFIDHSSNWDKQHRLLYLTNRQGGLPLRDNAWTIKLFPFSERACDDAQICKLHRNCCRAHGLKQSLVLLINVTQKYSTTEYNFMRCTVLGLLRKIESECSGNPTVPIPHWLNEITSTKGMENNIHHLFSSHGEIRIHYLWIFNKWSEWNKVIRLKNVADKLEFYQLSNLFKILIKLPHLIDY